MERNDQSSIFLVDVVSGRIKRLLLRSTIIRDCRAELAVGQDALRIDSEMNRLCEAYGHAGQVISRSGAARRFRSLQTRRILSCHLWVQFNCLRWIQQIISLTPNSDIEVAWRMLLRVITTHAELGAAGSST